MSFKLTQHISGQKMVIKSKIQFN